jgi:hypothetical protein
VDGRRQNGCSGTGPGGEVGQVGFGGLRKAGRCGELSQCLQKSFNNM